MSGFIHKTVLVLLVLLAFPLLLVGIVAGFVWEHLSMGWMFGRSASDWIGDGIEDHFPRREPGQ